MTKDGEIASSLPSPASEGCGTHLRAPSSASVHSEGHGTGSSHPRATSSASLHSEGRGQSSSSSSSLELSHASSFNSKDLLEVSLLHPYPLFSSHGAFLLP